MRVNMEIRAKEVRLVGDKGEQLGVMPLFQAREVANNKDLDLVEVAATAVPPVCRLLDYGKFKYEQAKKDREAKKTQKISLLREVRIRPKIGNHDFDSKARLARKLLEGGDKVKITVMFRGREISHPEIAWKLLQRMSDTLEDLASVEGKPQMEGRRMHVILMPISEQKTTSKVKEEVNKA
ncbi:translation initiation factor IF-3 [Chloroflexota bacterium]